MPQSQSNQLEFAPTLLNRRTDNKNDNMLLGVISTSLKYNLFHYDSAIVTLSCRDNILSIDKTVW